MLQHTDTTFFSRSDSLRESQAELEEHKVQES